MQRVEGDKGLLSVEKKLKMIGVELKKSEIDALNWYPVGYEPLIALVAKENFGWDDNDIFKRGRDSVKISLIVKK